MGEALALKKGMHFAAESRIDSEDLHRFSEIAANTAAYNPSGSQDEECADPAPGKPPIAPSE